MVQAYYAFAIHFSKGLWDMLIENNTNSQRQSQRESRRHAEIDVEIDAEIST
jgi:hypothetical protein